MTAPDRQGHGAAADSPYDAGFYERQVDGSARSAAVILPIIHRLLAPASVIDVGCGQGAWLAAAAALGATTLTGVDGPWVDRARLRHPGIRFMPVDIAGGEAIPVERHDLCISVEVAEHLPAQRAPAFVDALCAASDAVLFSAAVPHQGGTDHVNERRASYWAGLFAARGFECLDVVRGEVWDDARVEWWYRQNVLVFARRGSTAHARLAAGGPGRGPLDLVHPEAFESKMAYLLPRAGEGGATGPGRSRAKVRLALAFIAGVAVGALALAAALLRTSPPSAP
jgi:SAM-dependent methyltransferase